MAESARILRAFPPPLVRSRHRRARRVAAAAEHGGDACTQDGTLLAHADAAVCFAAGWPRSSMRRAELWVKLVQSAGAAVAAQAERRRRSRPPPPNVEHSSQFVSARKIHTSSFSWSMAMQCGTRGRCPWHGTGPRRRTPSRTAAHPLLICLSALLLLQNLVFGVCSGRQFTRHRGSPSFAAPGAPNMPKGGPLSFLNKCEAWKRARWWPQAPWRSFWLYPGSGTRFCPPSTLDRS